MKFFIAKSGDFETYDGWCLGDYIEYIPIRYSIEPKTGRLMLQVTVIHSLIHNDDTPEDGEWIVSDKSLMSLLFHKTKDDVLHKVTLTSKNFFGYKWVRPSINHAPLPIQFR